MAVYQLGSRIPQIDPSAYIHPEATIIGSVTLMDRVSIWPQTVLRGDTEPMTIGSGSNIQDGSVLHADPGFPLVIGANVTIGHQVMLHGCTIGDGSLIGIQSIVLNGAVIGKNCLVGAGSLVTEGKTFDDGSLILGRPARVVRPLRPDEIARLSVNAAVYVQRGAQYEEELKEIARGDHG